jgi:hypothetical protein
MWWKSDTMSSMSIDDAVRVLLGFTVLFAGRNIFWLFTSVIGVRAGVELAQSLPADQSAWLALVGMLARRQRL